MNRNNFFILIALSISISVSVWPMDQLFYFEQNPIQMSRVDDSPKCFILEIYGEKILLPNNQRNISTDNIERPNLSKEQINKLIELSKEKLFNNKSFSDKEIEKFFAENLPNSIISDLEDLDNLRYMLENFIVKLSLFSTGENIIYLVETILFNIVRITDEHQKLLEDISIAKSNTSLRSKIHTLYGYCNKKEKYKAILEALEVYGFYVKQVKKKSVNETYIIYKKNNNYRYISTSKRDNQNKCLVENNKDNALSSYAENYSGNNYHSQPYLGYLYSGQAIIPVDSHLQLPYFNQNQITMPVDNSYLQLNQDSFHLNQEQVHISLLDAGPKCSILKTDEGKILLLKRQKSTLTDNTQRPIFSKEKINKLVELFKQKLADSKSFSDKEVGKFLTENLHHSVMNDVEDLVNLRYILEKFVVKLSLFSSGEKGIYLLEAVLSNIVNIANKLKEPLEDILIDKRGNGRDKIFMLCGACDKKEKYRVILDALEKYGFYIRQIKEEKIRKVYIFYKKDNNYRNMLSAKDDGQNKCLLKDNEGNVSHWNKLKPKNKKLELKLTDKDPNLILNPNSEYTFSKEEKEQIEILIDKIFIKDDDLLHLNMWLDSKLGENDLDSLIKLLKKLVSSSTFIDNIKKENINSVIYLLNKLPFNIANIIKLNGGILPEIYLLRFSRDVMEKKCKINFNYLFIINTLKDYKFFVEFSGKIASIVYDPNTQSDSCFISNEKQEIILVDNPHRQYFLPKHDLKCKFSTKEIRNVLEKSELYNKDVEILKLWIDSKLDENDLDNLLILLRKFTANIRALTYHLNEKKRNNVIYLFKGVLVNIANIINSSNYNNKPLKDIWPMGRRKKNKNYKIIDSILENNKFFIRKYNKKSYIIYNINDEKDEYFVGKISKETGRIKHQINKRGSGDNKKHEITPTDNEQIKVDKCFLAGANEEFINKKPASNKRKADESNLEKEHPKKKQKTNGGITRFRIANRYLKQKRLKYYLFSKDAHSEQVNEALGEPSYRFLSLAQLDEQLKLKTSLNINLVKSSLYYDTDIAVELLYTGAEYSPATDFLSVVMAGRGLNGFVPHLEMNSFIVLVLSPKQYKDDKESYDLLLQKGYRLLLVHSLTTGLGQLKREELGLVTSRRIASLFLAQRLKAPNFMMLDDNLDGIFLSPNISNIKDSFIHIFGLLKEAAKNNDLSLLSIRHYVSNLDRAHPAASELMVKKEIAGSKLFYFDLSKLNEKQILKDTMWFFPPLVNIWGEDLFWHLALTQLELSVGVVNRLAMVMSRQHSHSDVCLISLDELGEGWLENQALKDYFTNSNDRALKGIYQTMQRIVKKNIKQRIRDQELIASLDLSQQTAIAAQKLDEWEKYPEWSLGPAINQQYQPIDLAARLLGSTLPNLLGENSLDFLFIHQHEALMTFVPKNNPPESRGYLEMATGSGKTLIINKLIEALLKDLPTGSNIALLLPTRELVDQAYESIIEYNNQQRSYINLKQVIAVDSDHISQAYLPVNRKLNAGGYLIIFCNKSFSNQLANKQNTLLIKNLKAILVDELHEAREDLLDSLVALQEERGTLLYGFSATPGAKAQYFDKQLYEYSRERGVKENILAPWQTHIIGKSSFKDINNKNIIMPSAVKRPKAFANFLQHADIYGDKTSLLKKKGLIFVPHKKRNAKESYAKKLVSSLKEYLAGNDIEIAEVSSDTLSKNKNTIKRFKDPLQNTNILVAVDMLTNGFDAKNIDYAIIDRYVTNKDKLIQMFGRALRKGKNGKVAQIFLQEGTYHRFKEIVLPPPVPMLPEKKYEDDMPMSDQIYYPEQNYGVELYH